MAYSNTMLKGRVGYCRGTNWPLIVMERAKSDKPDTPVLCEVWGFEHECGSCYYKDIVLATDFCAWEADVEAAGGGKRYFKGKIFAALDPVGESAQQIAEKVMAQNMKSKEFCDLVNNELI